MQPDKWHLFQFCTIQREFLNFLALATPHQPGLPVPKCRQSRQLPPGGSQEEVAGADSIQCTHPFQERWVAKNSNHLQIVYSRNRRAEELSGIANTADLLYTDSKGNLRSSQGTNGSGVSKTCSFKRCHHQHPAGGDDGSKQWGGIPLIHYRCQSYT